MEAAGIDAESDAWLHLEDEWMLLIADANLAFVRTGGRGVGKAQREPCRSLGLLKRHLGCAMFANSRSTGSGDFGQLREWHEPVSCPGVPRRRSGSFAGRLGATSFSQPSGGRRPAGSS